MTIIAPKSAQPPARHPETPPASETAPVLAAPQTAEIVPAAAPPERVGVVFVHGIGSQQPGETLLDWSRPLIVTLTDWRIAHGLPPDPVVETSIDFSGASLPTIEIDVPATPGGGDSEPAAAQRWVLTEAWWASRVRPPSLSTMTRWLREDFGRVVDGIRKGYDARAPRERRRRTLLRRTAGYEALRSAGVDDPRWNWIDRLDWVQKHALSFALGVAWFLGYLLLIPYAAIRAIPIPALRDATVLHQLDTFLVDWFGDMRLLLHDPAQAANVRARLADAVAGLESRGCTSIIVVAHSGGAVVSFTALCDPRWAPMPVTKFVTLGQGLDLAWRLENAWHGLPPGDRLITNLRAVYPNLRWVDYWASYDPATGGPLGAPPGVGAAPVDMPVRNRMSLLEDHGTYWDNEEEFVIPLLRELDTPSGPPSQSRFFRDRVSELIRIERRRQRVGLLAAWRWVCLTAGIVAVVGAALHAALAHGDQLRRLGESTAAVARAIPGSNVVSGPVDWFAGLRNWPDWLPVLGEWLLGAIVVAGAFALLARIGIARWDGWDERERWLGRSEPPRPLQRDGIVAEGAILVGVALVLALVIALT